MDNVKDLIKVTKSVADIAFKIPDIQRTTQTEESILHIKKLYDSYMKSWYKHQRYIIPGIISICCTKDGNEYLTDGQHRMMALQQLNDDFPERDMKIMVDYYILSDNNYEDLYEQINTIIPNGITKMKKDFYKITNELEKMFDKTFKEYIQQRDKPYIPCINLTQLTNYINTHEIITRANIIDADDLWTRILELNKFYSKVSEPQFTTWDVPHIGTSLDKIRKKSPQLYVGIYKNYEWLDRIVDAYENNLQYNQLQHYNSSYRPKMTKALRTSVWNSPMVEGKCYVCEKLIQNTHFECAHIIPVSIGGKTILSNLKPTCHDCNKEMGTMNLETFKQIYQSQK